jgi:hypothetical protein
MKVPVLNKPQRLHTIWTTLLSNSLQTERLVCLHYMHVTAGEWQIQKEEMFCSVRDKTIHF